MPRPDISVVAPVRNGAAFLGDLLAALDAQTLDPQRFETIVVDDGSIDETPALLADWKRADPERRRTSSSGGRGPAAARNAGIGEARGDWIVFTDCDTIPDSGWLEAVLASRQGADGVEGRVLRRPGEALSLHAHCLENAQGGLYVTANMAYSRTILERVGGFDETFREAFLEDSDLAFRVLDAGGTIVFAPSALVWHRVVPRTWGDVLRAARKQRWLPLLERKHPERYRTSIRPILQPVTRPEAHVLLGIAGLGLVAAGRGRLLGALLALNGARVVAGSGRLNVPARELPAAAALSVANPVAKAAWWLGGYVRSTVRSGR